MQLYENKSSSAMESGDHFKNRVSTRKTTGERVGILTASFRRLSRKTKVLLGAIFTSILLCCLLLPQKHNNSELVMLYFKDNDLFFKYIHPINNIQGKYCYYKAYCEVLSKTDSSITIDNILKIEEYVNGIVEETTLIEQEEDGYEKRTLLNRNGAITKDENGVSIYRLKRKDGSLYDWDVFCYNRYNKLIEDNTGVAQYKYSNTDSIQIIEYLDHNGRQIQNKDKVYRIYIYYNAQKYIDSIKYYANKNNHLIDGVAQIRYEYNEKNECIKRSNYDKYGNPANDNNGITFYEYEYDNAGNLIRKWNRIIINGKLAIGERVMRKYSYNTDGNQEKIQLYNILYRAPYFTVVDTVLTEYDIAEYNYEYKNGKLVAEFYRNNHHNTMTDEYGIARYTYEYDKKDNQTKKMNYGIDNRPAENIYGIATYKWEYDKYGNNTQKSSYGIDGKLKENEDGVATYKWKYDSNGSMTEESFYGIDGKPVADKYVIATYKWEYDSNGNNTKVSYYNIEGKLTANQYGTATYKYEYGNNGNITKKSYCGSDGKFIHDGDVICRWEYDKYGNTTKQNWFDKNGKIDKDKYGVETYEWVYDDNGNMLEESYHDADGNLTTDTYGKAIMQWTYDYNGKITYESYWGIDRKSIINKYNGLAAIAYKYDEKQRMTEKKCYGINGLKENIDGFCMYKWEYEGDTCETFSQFGVVGTTGTYLKEDSLGIAKTITRKDNIGRLTEKSYINRNKSLVADKSGIAKYIYEYADTWTWEVKTIHCFNIHDKEIKDIPEFIKQRAASQTQEASSRKDKWQNTTGYEKTNLSIHNGDIVDNSDNSTNSHIESNNTTNLILNWNLIFEFALISLAVNLSVAITIFFFKKKKKIINRIKKLFIH